MPHNFFKWLFSVEGSTIIQNLGLGIGGFLGGLVGLRYIIEWYQKIKRQFRIGNYLQRYPPTLENQASGWELVYDPKRFGHIYLLDHTNKTKHWVANFRTFQDLFRYVPDPHNEKKNQLFNQYILGKNIITVGHPEP